MEGDGLSPDQASRQVAPPGESPHRDIGPSDGGAETAAEETSTGPAESSGPRQPSPSDDSNEANRGRHLSPRSIVLLAIAVLALLVGWNWKQDSNEPMDTLSRQQVIQVFVSDPNAKVQLTATYPSIGPRTRLQDLFLSIAPPPSLPNEDISWALVALDHPIDCIAPALGNIEPGKPTPPLVSSLVFGIKPHLQPESAWLCQGDTNGTSFSSLATLSQLSLPNIGLVRAADPSARELTDGALVSQTPMQDLNDQSGGEFFAQLPALDLEPISELGLSLVIGIHHYHGDQLQDVLNEAPKPLAPSSSTSTAIDSYERWPGTFAILPVSFYAPMDISTQAFLDLTNTESRLVKYKIDQVNPSDGAFTSGGYLWTGEGFIEPTVSLSDPASDAARSQDALLAGVALAIGASAVIAFIQELPRTARRRRIFWNPFAALHRKDDEGE